MTTALDLAGTDREGVEFQSVPPILADERKGLDAVYGAYMGVQLVVIKDGWKLIPYSETRVTRLSHFTGEPRKMEDLADDPALAGREKRPSRSSRKLQNNYNDKLKMAAGFPTSE